MNLRSVVLAGVSALRNGLDCELRQYLPMGYDDFVLYGDECGSLELNLTNNERQRAFEHIIITVAEAMHDAWAESRLVEFEEVSGATSEARVTDVQFKRLFVPFPLLGWKIAGRYCWMALRLLGDLKLPPMEARLKMNYGRWTETFCTQNEIFNAEALQGKLMEGSKFYHVLSGVAEEKLMRKQSAQSVAQAILKEL